jgi:hypothetical protein
LATDKKGTCAFIGTEIGAFRIYDLVNRADPRLVLQLRFFEDLIPIDCIKASPDGEYVLISSQ